MTDSYKPGPAAIRRAARIIGKRGGESTLKKHGDEQFRKMARRAHLAMKRKYGKRVYTLIRRGVKVKGTTAKQREDELSKIDAEKKARTH